MPLRSRLSPLIRVVLLSGLLGLSGCASSYEHVVGGGVVGGMAGAAGGALCCHDPVRDTGRGALIGIAIGALAGALWDML